MPLRKLRPVLRPSNGLVIPVILILIFSIFTTMPVLAQDNEDTFSDDTRQNPEVYFTDEINDFGLDTNEDELFDYLIIKLLVGIEVPGAYEIGSKLILTEDYPPIYVYKEFETEDEFIEIQLKFDGEHIYGSGVSGNYLCILWLDNLTGETITTTEYPTGEYKFADFKHAPPPIQVTEHFEDFGIDTNRNQLFEVLTVRISVEVIEPGLYFVIGGLFKELEAKEEEKPEPFYFWITHTEIRVELKEGRNQIELKFKGPNIWLSELNGPYLVGLWIEDPEKMDYKSEEMTPEEKVAMEERIKKRLTWPMVGEGDLSGDIVFETQEYLFKNFEEPIKIVSITKQIREIPVDLNNNDLYDFLRLSVGVNITESGRYLLVGQIVTKDELNNIWAENFTHLRSGIQHIVLNFRGLDIHKNRLDGVYTIILEIKGDRPDEMKAYDRIKYSTQKKYYHKEFESKYIIDGGGEIPDDSRPQAWIDPEGITTKTDIIEVFTTRTRPEITFWYADSDENRFRFKLIYQRLIGYRDLNQNNRYDFGEETFEAILQDNLWNINGLEYSVNSKYGNYIEFELSAELDLEKLEPPERNLKERLGQNEEPLNEPGKEPVYFSTRAEEQTSPEQKLPNIAQNWARLTFKFLITSNDFTLDEPFTYEINGGTELKIDIDLEFYRPVNLDGICLEQILFDEERDFGFKTKESNRELIYNKGTFDNNLDSQEKREMQLFEPNIEGVKQSILFIDDSEKEYGFYSWVNKINVTYIDGRHEIVSINTTYVTDGEVLRLFTNYPYNQEISGVNHDPSIGMVKESKPKRKSVIDDITKILFNPLFYITACLIALVILGLMRRSQMKQKGSSKQGSSGPPEEPEHRPKRHQRQLKRY